MCAEKLLAGWYRVSSANHFCNVKREREGLFAKLWSVDVHKNNGDLVEYAGVWKTKREAVEVATRVLAYRERVTA